MRGRKLWFCCSNGVLGPNMYVAAATISDGLSNTLAIGEQSDWITKSDGTRSICGPATCTAPGSAQARPAGRKTTRGLRPSRRPPLSQLHHDAVSVRLQDGCRRRGCNWHGREDDTGTNLPVQSVHPGVVGVARCDGSVDFLSEATAWTMQRNLAVRDDGQLTDRNERNRMLATRPMTMPTRLETRKPVRQRCMVRCCVYGLC